MSVHPRTRSEWPGRWVKVLREHDDKDELVFVGYVSEVVPDGKGNVKVTATGPEGLLPPQPNFPPPMRSLGSEPAAFDFWWTQLEYVFGLSDPASFPPLTQTLDAESRKAIHRYVGTAEDLARSTVLNALDNRLTVREDDATGAELIESTFSAKDAQLGFAGLLRQMDIGKEQASYERVAGILWQAAEAATDHYRQERLDVLKSWSMAIKRLHGKSLNQLLRERFVEEGALVLDYDEPDSPEFLLSSFNYGDLLHWGLKRETIAKWEEDEFAHNDRRLAFLLAAAGLAHLYIGFGILARAAISGEIREGG